MSYCPLDRTNISLLKYVSRFRITQNPILSTCVDKMGNMQHFKKIYIFTKLVSS